MYDITADFLEELEQATLNRGVVQPSIDSYNRHLRSIINHFMKVEKLISLDYDYPYRKGGYQIKNSYPPKLVMKNAEIQQVVEFSDFETPEQEFARDIWLALYRCNGINFIDLLLMRWSDIKGDYIIFFPEKTRTTRKKNKKPIVVPVTPKLRQLIDKLGDKNSPFILGLLKEDYTKENLNYMNDTTKKMVNKELGFLNQALNISIPLQIKTARDAYVTTLRRADHLKEDMGDMVGHGDIITIEHYVGPMEVERTFEINECLF